MPGPFQFMTSVEAVQLTGIKAASLQELYEGLQKVDDASIYHHTHRFYRAHSFLGHSDRSDFALWVAQNLREEAVAERLGALDLRDYPTLSSLREAVFAILEPFREEPDRWARRVPPGLEFHFCRAVSLVLSTGHRASNLEEFVHGLERVDASCIHYHLIEAQLHYHGPDDGFHNDFSQWLLDLGFPEQAEAVAALDPYQGDLENVRKRLVGIVRGNRLRDTFHRIADRLSHDPAGEAASHWLKRWRKES
ncbi:MAG TPA: DUF5752 family protein [bacterium]|nr:DUF5752 family protein [bacterium]